MRPNSEESTGPVTVWMVAMGVLRYQHLQRSQILRVSECRVHCFCPKGKQKKLRTGFYFCMPSIFLSGWDWAAAWREQFEQLPPRAREKCGLCFDPRGGPWSRGESVAATQEVFRDLVANIEELTSYSWRRVGTSAGQLLGFTSLELNGLGDWTDKAQDSQAKMPLHYSGMRYLASAGLKTCAEL